MVPHNQVTGANVREPFGLLEARMGVSSYKGTV